MWGNQSTKEDPQTLLFGNEDMYMSQKQTFQNKLKGSQNQNMFISQINTYNRVTATIPLQNQKISITSVEKQNKQDSKILIEQFNSMPEVQNLNNNNNLKAQSEHSNQQELKNEIFLGNLQTNQQALSFIEKDYLKYPEFKESNIITQNIRKLNTINDQSQVKDNKFVNKDPYQNNQTASQFNNNRIDNNFNAYYKDNYNEMKNNYATNEKQNNNIKNNDFIKEINNNNNNSNNNNNDCNKNFSSNNNNNVESMKQSYNQTENLNVEHLKSLINQVVQSEIKNNNSNNLNQKINDQVLIKPVYENNNFYNFNVKNIELNNNHFPSSASAPIQDYNSNNVENFNHNIHNNKINSNHLNNNLQLSVLKVSQNPQTVQNLEINNKNQSYDQEKQQFLLETSNYGLKAQNKLNQTINQDLNFFSNKKDIMSTLSSRKMGQQMSPYLMPNYIEQKDATSFLKMQTKDRNQNSANPYKNNQIQNQSNNEPDKFIQKEFNSNLQNDLHQNNLQYNSNKMDNNQLLKSVNINSSLPAKDSLNQNYSSLNNNITSTTLTTINNFSNYNQFQNIISSDNYLSILVSNRGYHSANNIIEELQNNQLKNNKDNNETKNANNNSSSSMNQDQQQILLNGNVIPENYQPVSTNQAQQLEIQHFQLLDQQQKDNKLISQANEGLKNQSPSKSNYFYKFNGLVSNQTQNKNQNIAQKFTLMVQNKIDVKQDLHAEERIKFSQSFDTMNIVSNDKSVMRISDQQHKDNNPRSPGKIKQLTNQQQKELDNTTNNNAFGNSKLNEYELNFASNNEIMNNHINNATQTIIQQNNTEQLQQQQKNNSVIQQQNLFHYIPPAKNQEKINEINRQLISDIKGNQYQKFFILENDLERKIIDEKIDHIKQQTIQQQQQEEQQLQKQHDYFSLFEKIKLESSPKEKELQNLEKEQKILKLEQQLIEKETNFQIKSLQFEEKEKLLQQKEEKLLAIDQQQRLSIQINKFEPLDSSTSPIRSPSQTLKLSRLKSEQKKIEVSPSQNKNNNQLNLIIQRTNEILTVNNQKQIEWENERKGLTRKLFIANTEIVAKNEEIKILKEQITNQKNKILID